MSGEKKLSIPLPLEGLGKFLSHEFFTTPTVKGIEFAISLMVTALFAYSFIHVNRNLYRRDQEIERMDKIIIQNQAQLTLLDAKIVKLKETLHPAPEMSSEK
jgi:hypothetical protein